LWVIDFLSVLLVETWLRFKFFLEFSLIDEANCVSFFNLQISGILDENELDPWLGRF